MLFDHLWHDCVVTDPDEHLAPKKGNPFSSEPTGNHTPSRKTRTIPTEVTGQVPAVENATPDFGPSNMDTETHAPIRMQAATVIEETSFVELLLDTTVDAPTEIHTPVTRRSPRARYRYPCKCKSEGCAKQAQGSDYCIKHGGGRRCKTEGCNHFARARGLCAQHGGGPRCKTEGCDKFAISDGLCIPHGGGQRCKIEGCNKLARGATDAQVCQTYWWSECTVSRKAARNWH